MESYKQLPEVFFKKSCSEKETVRCFSVDTVKSLRTPFLKDICERLLQSKGSAYMYLMFFDAYVCNFLSENVVIKSTCISIPEFHLAFLVLILLIIIYVVGYLIMWNCITIYLVHAILVLIMNNLTVNIGFDE